MDHSQRAGSQRADRVDVDRRARMEFRGAQISSDGGLVVMRELDDPLWLSDLAAASFRDTRRGKNTFHQLDGLFRQSVFGRLAGYEDVNDADRLALDPVMRQVVGSRAVGGAWRGHFDCTCYHPNFLFNQFGMLETSLQLKLIMFGARVVRRARAITFQLAEVAVTGPMACAILAAIRRLRAPPSCA